MQLLHRRRTSESRLLSERHRAICTTPKPSRIKPIALIAEKIKSDKLFMVESGSAANAVVDIADSSAAEAIRVYLAFLSTFVIFSIFFIVFFTSKS